MGTGVVLVVEVLVGAAVGGGGGGGGGGQASVTAAGLSISGSPPVADTPGGRCHLAVRKQEMKRVTAE